MLKRKELIEPILKEKAQQRRLKELFFDKRRSAPSALLIVLLVVPVVTAAFGSYRFYQANPQSIGEITETEDKADKSAFSSAVAVPTPPHQQAIQAELITINSRGFEPSFIRRPSGKVLLNVVNRSELPTMTLRLERENGTVLGQAQLPRERRSWRQIINLPAGRYRIVDANRSGISCSIEITP